MNNPSKTINDPTRNLVKKAMDNSVQMPRFLGCPRVGSSFKEAAMSYYREGGSKSLSESITEDVMYQSFKKQEIADCARKFEEIILQTRIRLGLEVAK